MKEVHLCEHTNGHVKSTDCWCEPKHIAQVRGRDGNLVLIVEHEDMMGALAHELVVEERNKHRTLPCSGNFVDLPINRCAEAPWITRALDYTPPPLLPPHDPNERSL